MKRVLIVAFFYPPSSNGGVYRTLGMVRHLPEFGWEPVVLTSSEAGRGGDPELIQDLGGVETIRVPAPGRGGVPRAFGGRRPLWAQLAAGAARLFMIPDSYVGWRGPAIRAGLERIRKGGIDAIYSTSPPDTDHLVALELRRVSGLPWVADFRDPWVGLTFYTPPTPWHRLSHESGLLSVLRGAQCVVAATEGTRRWLTAREPSMRARSRVISNGYEEDEWRGVNPRDFDRFTILHAGRLSGDRTIASFLPGLEQFLARDPKRRALTQCVVLGPHDASEELAVKRARLSDVVRFEGFRPHREVLEMEAGANLLLLIKHRAAAFRDLIPGKLYEYMGAGRPVLAVAPESPAAELVRALGLGWVAPPGDPERVCEALEQAFAGRSPAQHTPSDRTAFTRRALTAELARALGELA